MKKKQNKREEYPKLHYGMQSSNSRMKVTFTTKANDFKKINCKKKKWQTD